VERLEVPLVQPDDVVVVLDRHPDPEVDLVVLLLRLSPLQVLGLGTGRAGQLALLLLLLVLLLLLGGGLGARAGFRRGKRRLRILDHGRLLESQDDRDEKIHRVIPP